jgi:hypothetical protein
MAGRGISSHVEAFFGNGSVVVLGAPTALLVSLSSQNLTRCCAVLPYPLTIHDSPPRAGKSQGVASGIVTGLSVNGDQT